MQPSKTDRKIRPAEFASLYQEALEAGKAALESMMDDNQWGCGFAEVCVKGNSAFGRWAVRERGWERSYPRGVGMSISYRAVGLSISDPTVPRQFLQSESHKAAYAHAFANVLRNAGISVWVESRPD
jgi:hypothetical protein